MNPTGQAQSPAVVSRRSRHCSRRESVSLFSRFNVLTYFRWPVFKCPSCPASHDNTIRYLVIEDRTISLRHRMDSAEFLCESDEKPFGPADVAEPICVLIPDHVANELRAAVAEPFQRLVDVVHGEHDAEVA
jgi:hypothetical protein